MARFSHLLHRNNRAAEWNTRSYRRFRVRPPRLGSASPAVHDRRGEAHSRAVPGRLWMTTAPSSARQIRSVAFIGTAGAARPRWRDPSRL